MRIKPGLRWLGLLFLLAALLPDAHLPVQARGVKIKDVLDSYGYDKKFVTGSNRFVLPKRAGYVEVVGNIPALLIKTVLKKYVRA